MNYFGDFVDDATVYIPFNTFDSNDPSASVTITNLAASDVEVWKNGVVQTTPGAGVTLTLNIGTNNGSHLIAVDTSNTTDAGWFATGNDYQVRINGTTVDGATINAWVGSFSIQNRFMRGTDSAALASVLGAAVGATISADIADLPTVAEFEARTIVSADYVVVGDTIAGVTLVTTTTTNSDMVGTNSAALASVLGAAVGASISADIAAVKAETASIQTETTALDTLTKAAGDGDLAAVLLDTAEIGTAGAGLTNITINAASVTAVWAKAMSDLAQGAPSATASVLVAINYIYEFLRNKTTTTATLITVMKDDGSTGLVKSTISDDGTTFTKGEFITGA